MIRKVQAIIYDLKNGVPYFLVFHRVLHWKGWEFLKETVEPGETRLGCLRRGILEETHLRHYRIERRLNKQSRWRWNERPVKIVQVYLIRAPMRQKINIRQKIIEHDRHRWVTKNEALRLLTHPSARQWLRSLYLRA